MGGTRVFLSNKELQTMTILRVPRFVAMWVGDREILGFTAHVIIDNNNYKKAKFILVRL